jgi:CRISPR-associated protein Csb2
MPTVQIRFPAGRYHATPPTSHVNEGHIEWPPSPWRLLRALIACGFNTQHWAEIPDVAKSLIEKLASHPPRYWLPRVSMAHTRHYMPIGVIDSNAREKTTLVFDTWADVGAHEIIVFWDCELDKLEQQLLVELVECLGYLGRSESWVEARVIENSSFKPNTFPFFANDPPGPGWEQIHVLGPIAPRDYATWYQRKTNALLSELPVPDSKMKTTSKAVKDILKLREKAIEPFPRDLLDCLTKDTAWWKARKWASPPGSRPLLYWRPTDQMEVSPPTTPRETQTHGVTTVLLAITTRTGNRASLPPVSRTLPQAEILHRQLVGIVNKQIQKNCPELTGCDDDKNPLRLPHQHAHVLPLDLDGDGHLDHVLIHAAMELGAAAQRAIRALRKTFAKNVSNDFQLAIAGIGGISQLLKLHLARSIVSSGNVWKSITPFVPPRFLKKSGKNSLEGQIQSELASRGLPAAESISILANETLAFRHYVRARKHGRNPPQPPVEVGYALELKFAEPLTTNQLPLCLGYASHFGLGIFGLSETDKID